MFLQIKQLASESLVYGVSSIVTRFLSFFLIPIYTKIFEPSDYGTLSLVNNTFALIGIVVVLGLDSAASVYFYDLEGDDRKKTISTWFWTQAILGAFFFLSVFCFRNSLSTQILGDPQNSIYFLLASLNIVFTALPMVTVNWFRMKRKPLHCVLFTLGNSLLVIIGNLIAVVVLSMGLLGVFISTLIASLIFSVIAWAFIKDWIRFSFFDKNLLKKMLKFSSPLIPASFAFWILNSAAVYFVELYCTRTEVGLYQIGNSLASGMFLVIGAFQLAWGPFAFSIQKQENARQVYAQVFIIYIVITSGLFVFLALFSKEILLVLTRPEYEGAYLVGSILAFNFVLNGLHYVAAIGLNLAKTNSPYATAIIISSLFTLVLYNLLIPALGKEGAALSTLLGQIFVPVYMFYKSQKLYFIPYNFTRAIGILGTGLLVVVTGAFVSFDSFFLEFQVKGLLVLLFLIAIAVINKNLFLKGLRLLKLKKI